MYNSGFGAYPQDDMDMGVNSYFGESDTNFFDDTSNDSFFGEGCGVTGFGNGEFFNESVGFSTDGSKVISEAYNYSENDVFVEGDIKPSDGEYKPNYDPKRHLPKDSHERFAISHEDRARYYDKEAEGWDQDIAKRKYRTLGEREFFEKQKRMNEDSAASNRRAANRRRELAKKQNEKLLDRAINEGKEKKKEND